MCNYVHKHGHYGLLFCIGLYTNIDLFINITKLLIIYLTTIKLLLQIACLYKHIFMDILVFYKTLALEVTN